MILFILHHLSCIINDSHFSNVTGSFMNYIIL
nr:MAG TPA: hypothetical protein [Caudoviricetes sp.]